MKDKKFEIGYDKINQALNCLSHNISEGAISIEDGHDIHSKLFDFVEKAGIIAERVRNNKDLNRLEQILYDVVSRFSNITVNDDNCLMLAYDITKGIYYPLPRR